MGKLDTEGQLFHLGLNYILAPQLKLDQVSFLQLQTALIEKGLTFEKTEREDRGFALLREAQAPNLQFSIRNDAVGPFAQILVVEPRPNCALELFIKRVSSCLEAVQSVWAGAKFQIIKKDACIRQIYEYRGDHAFKYIWEEKLGQGKDSVTPLSRSIFGGGIRLVLPPPIDQPNGATVEIKIESLLENPKFVFVETMFYWNQPSQPGTGFGEAKLLREVYDYSKANVLEFLVRSQGTK